MVGWESRMNVWDGLVLWDGLPQFKPSMVAFMQNGPKFGSDDITVLWYSCLRFDRPFPTEYGPVLLFTF